MKQLILASASPRRQAFMATLGVDFAVFSPDIDETPLEHEPPADLVRRLSQLKAGAAAGARAGSVVVAADTVVVLDGEILGKPRDREDAFRMLKKLSGRTHEVITGFTVQEGARRVTECVRTEVTFAALDDELIRAYVACGESDDKSGSYAVQGLAAMFVLSVNGSVSSVVGLPICQVRQILERFGIRARPAGA